jgi:lysyl-tRNA synthetase class 1
VPHARVPLTFALLLNLVGVASTDDKELLWGFVRQYVDGVAPETHPEVDALIDHALVYFRDFVAGSLQKRPPTETEAAALRELDALLAEDDGTGREEEDPAAVLQNHVYEIGKAHFGKERLRDWFRTLYETLLGSDQGPRMGSFIALYGVANTRRLIAEALSLSDKDA